MMAEITLGVAIGLGIGAAFFAVAEHRRNKARERQDNPHGDFLDGLRRIYENDKEKNP